MQHSKIIREGTTLQITLHSSFIIGDYNAISVCYSEMSSEYLICGLIKFQVKNHISKIYSGNNSSSKYSHVISIKLNKAVTDKLNYEIKLSSVLLKIKDNNLSAENENWQIIINEVNNQGLIDIIDLTISVDIHGVNTTNTGLFRNLYEDNELTDFELRGIDGSVSMHKMVLALYSPVMKTMLSGQWKEVDAGAVEVPDTSKDTLQQLKDFMYMQKLPENGIEQLAKLAAYYMIPDLLQCCTFKMLKSLTASNAPECLEFALKYRIKDLFFSILEMIKANHLLIEDIKQTNTLFHD